MSTVSVVIPAHNAGKYINQAVDSVLAQTYQDVECIVVDDGSTDDTPHRLARYVGRIVYIRQENQGRTAARNAGIAASKGEYIAFLDADDYWHPDKIAKQLLLMESNPAFGAVGCGAIQVTSDGAFVREIPAASSPRLRSGISGFAALVTLEFTMAAPLSALLIRKECFEKVGNFDKRINTMEEWDLLLRLILDWDIGTVDQPLVFYRGYDIHVARKVAPRKRQDKYLEVVNLAFSRVENLDNMELLYQRSVGLAYLRGGLIDYAIGNIGTGKEKFMLAYEYAPELFSSDTAQWLQVLVYFAAYLYDLITPIEESLEFIHHVFANLPPPLTRLQALERQALARVCMIHVFDSYPRKDWRTIREVGMRALLYDPMVLYNRGFVSILAEAWIGSRVMHWLRNVSRRLDA